MSDLVRFADCASSVFISYAHADNEVYGNWITDFTNELVKDLKAELSRVPLGRPDFPPPHLSQYNGPVAGELSQALRERVTRSFSMVIVVGRHYVASDWCLKELAYFHQAFGGAGLDERLQIVALGDTPMRTLSARPLWRDVFAQRNPVWTEFFDAGLDSRPVPVLRDDGHAPTQAFSRRFDRLRDDLVARIKADAARPVAVRQASGLLVGVGLPELDAAVQRFVADARAQDPGVNQLEPAALRRNLTLAERLRDAERLVLPVSGGQPLYPSPSGGHLATQVDAWRKLGKPDEHLFLLDLSSQPAAEPAEPEHQQWLDALPQVRLAPQPLLARLYPPQVAADAARAVKAAAAKPVRLLIESNQNEPRQWKLLGEQIRLRWQKLLAERGIQVPLNLRTSGMNIDEIDLFNLDEADGLILLWGQKEARSLLSQINLVEDRLSDPAPAIVAYLSPPKPRADRAVPALGWQVLRFSQRDQPPPEQVAPEADDESELTQFLTEVLDRTGRRHNLALDLH